MLHLTSDLWLDQPDAHERIDQRCTEGRLSPEEATRLHTFTDSGYIVMPIGLDQAFCDAFDADIARIWRDRPADLSISPPGFAPPMSFADFEGEVRERGYRIPDLHSHSERALDLYLHPAIFRMLELIYGEPALAFQSLYFEYGSQQAPHRDPMFVVTKPPSHLLAAWVALEDVTPDCGPISYVPGSHRLPWFEFESGSVACAKQVPPTQRQEFQAWVKQEMREREMVEMPFTCKRGDVLIWHGGLLHAGMKIQKPGLTRKSFVVHYSTAAHYQTRTAGMRVREGDGWRSAYHTTSTVLSRDGGRGLQNPVREEPKVDTTEEPAPKRLRWLRRRR